MNYTITIPMENLAALRPIDIQSYLLVHGWEIDPSASTSKIALFRFPMEPEAEVLLPMRRELADYTERVNDLIHVIAAVEERAAWEILNDLTPPPGDVLHLRVCSPEAKSGLMPLEEGVQLIQGGKELLLAAACSTHYPRAFYPRQSYTEAIDFIRDCRLGQTEQGSFVATIIAPVPPALRASAKQNSFLPEEENVHEESNEPFSRRVMINLMRGLGIYSEAIQTGAFDRIMAGVLQGVSANMCDALAKMKPPGDHSSLDIRVNWARTRPAVPPQIPHKVSFARDDFQIIEEAGRELRRQAESSSERIDGFIVDLHADTSLFEGFQGKVEIKRGTGNSRVKVILNRDHYVLACDAHRDGKKVSVEGTLHRDATMRIPELLHPRGFKVLPENT